MTFLQTAVLEKRKTAEHRKYNKEISDITLTVGGCAPNTAINLVKTDRNIPVSVTGKEGMDNNGRFIVSQLQRNGIDVERITYSAEVPTSFTDVRSMLSGERTFF